MGGSAHQSSHAPANSPRRLGSQPFVCMPPPLKPARRTVASARTSLPTRTPSDFPALSPRRQRKFPPYFKGAKKAGMGRNPRRGKVGGRPGVTPSRSSSTSCRPTLRSCAPHGGCLRRIRKTSRARGF
ncbi:hypothetical protein T492DRAFT_40175 [Pavlovales sp. CCMP2436]|nr:hypothetical protein T492DRAFT_40175 [Pavlovales sp. CCMP2436]